MKRRLHKAMPPKMTPGTYAFFALIAKLSLAKSGIRSGKSGKKYRPWRFFITGVPTSLPTKKIVVAIAKIEATSVSTYEVRIPRVSLVAIAFGGRIRRANTKLA